MITDHARDFARLRTHLHRGGRWFYLWTLEGKTTQWFAVGREPTLLRGKVDIYFGVHPTDKPKGKRQRATNEDVSAINCLFADLDAKSFDGSKELALAHVESLTPVPSVIIDSGGGYHAYWLLRDSFTIDDDTDRKRARTAQANWVEFVGGDPGAKDLARVLRVPGTVNYKKEYAPNFPTVTILQAEWNRQYTLHELEGAAHQVEAPKPVRSKRVSPSSGNGHGKYVDAALAGELDKLARTSEGARNTQLNASAFALGQLVVADTLDRSYVENQLLNVAQTTGLGVQEAAATIRSGLDAGMKEPRPIPGSGNGHGA
jgi:hypothetical protein